MENISSASIGDMLTDSIDTITPDDTVTVAKRRMESQTSRSLIVVDGNRPVGVIQWRGLARHDGNEMVRDVMQTEFPVLRSGMSVDEVRSYLSGMDVDIDHLPVVDESARPAATDENNPSASSVIRSAIPRSDRIIDVNLPKGDEARRQTAVRRPAAEHR